MADVEVEISALAYNKIVLHAARYPHCAINGVLLVERQKNKEKGIVNFVDCVPLFHISLGLSPMLEVALNQIDAYCQENNLVIGGYYQANENLEDSSYDETAKRTASRISDNCSDSYLFMINNGNTYQYTDEDLLIGYQCKDGKLNKLENGYQLENGSLDAVKALLHENVYRDFIDFDNHLDDITLDWRNVDIGEKVNILLS